MGFKIAQALYTDILGNEIFKIYHVAEKMSDSPKASFFKREKGWCSVGRMSRWR